LLDCHFKLGFYSVDFFVELLGLTAILLKVGSCDNNCGLDGEAN